MVALSIACLLRLFGSDPVVALTLMHTIFICSPMNFSGGLGLYPPRPYWKLWTARLLVRGWDDDSRVREVITWRSFWHNNPRNGALLLATGACWVVFYKFALPNVTCDSSGSNITIGDTIACDRILEGSLGSWVWWVGVVYYTTVHTYMLGVCYSLLANPRRGLLLCCSLGMSIFCMGFSYCNPFGRTAKRAGVWSSTLCVCLTYLMVFAVMMAVCVVAMLVD